MVFNLGIHMNYLNLYRALKDWLNKFKRAVKTFGAKCNINIVTSILAHCMILRPAIHSSLGA
jgi:hypothetical protein